MAATLELYKGLSENQGRVASGERQISDKQMAVYHPLPGLMKPLKVTELSSVLQKNKINAPRI